MSYKQFLDESGNRWQVWDVVPEGTERRLRERRVVHDPPAEEKRGLVDRRGSGPRGTDSRGDLPPELTDGWLVFQSVQGKRRYWPIPPDWHNLSDRELRELCRNAHQVVRDASGFDAPTPRQL